MGIDTSIYSNLRPAEINIPSPFDAAQKAMSLSQLGMQNQQMQYQMGQTNAIRQAMSANMGPDGKLNREGFLSQIGKTAPMAQMDYQQRYIKQDKEQADLANVQQEAKNKQLDAAEKWMGVVWPGLNYVAGAKDKPQAYSAMLANLKAQGIDTSQMSPDYHEPTFATQFEIAKDRMPVIKSQTEQAVLQQKKLDTAITAAEAPYKIAKAKADVGEISNKRALELKDDLDPNKAKGGNMARNQLVVDSADRLNAMFKQFPDYNIPKAQQTELISAFGALLNGGSAPFVSQLDELIPKSARGDANATASWFLNEPKGAEQQKFMQLLHDSVNREREVADTKVKMGQVQRLAAHDVFKGTNPEQYWSILHGYGIEPEHVKNGKYVGPSQEDTQLADQKKDGKGLIPEANAGTRAMSPPPVGSIWMRSPNGKIKAIPESQKGEAIAAGGSVVK